MIDKKLTLTTLLLFSSLACFAEEKCAVVAGNLVIGPVTIGCMKVSGSATLKQSQLKGDLELKGPLVATDSQLTSLHVVGSATLINCTLTDKAWIEGKITATGTTFAKTLHAKTDQTSLTNAMAEKIEIINAPQQSAYVYLKNTTVNGNIVFEGGNGIVKSVQSIIKGKVIGGKIEE